MRRKKQKLAPHEDLRRTGAIEKLVQIVKGVAPLNKFTLQSVHSPNRIFGKRVRSTPVSGSMQGSVT